MQATISCLRIPKAFLSCKEGVNLFESKTYQQAVKAIVVDEAHCILEWRDDFRKDYSRLAIFCATFPNVPVVALTATASKSDWCGFSFKYVEKQLGNEQYYPQTTEALPENRLFAQFHAPQTRALEDQILSELASPESNVRVIFATVAMGMGVSRNTSRKQEEQAEMGNQPLLCYFNNSDISKNKAGMSKDIRTFCRLGNECLRKILFKCLDAREGLLVPSIKVKTTGLGGTRNMFAYSSSQLRSVSFQGSSMVEASRCTAVGLALAVGFIFPVHGVLKFNITSNQWLGIQVISRNCYYEVMKLIYSQIHDI
ncbi:hypothetical protein ACROYT_G014775 [Oculina patagonica]